MELSALGFVLKSLLMFFDQNLTYHCVCANTRDFEWMNGIEKYETFHPDLAGLGNVSSFQKCFAYQQLSVWE